MPTLEEVEVAFSQWRVSKVRKYERVPENLMGMARTLVAEHGAVTVSKRLGISSRKFLPKSETLSSEFIEVPRPPAELPPPWAIVVHVKFSSKKEMTVTVPANNRAIVSELLKKISKL